MNLARIILLYVFCGVITLLLSKGFLIQRLSDPEDEIYEPPETRTGYYVAMLVILAIAWPVQWFGTAAVYLIKLYKWIASP